MLNAETGEMLMKAPTPNVLRLNRKRFREVVSEGLDIEVRLEGNDATVWDAEVASLTMGMNRSLEND